MEKVSNLYSLDSYPALPCPYCNSPNLKIDKKSFSTRPLSGHVRKAYVEKFKNNDLMELVEKDDNNFIKFIAVAATLIDSATHRPSHFISFFCVICVEKVYRLPDLRRCQQIIL